MLQSLLEDMRFASRSLRSSPFIVATTVFSLSIGIAAVTAVFSLGNALLLREPTWLRDPAQLVTIYTSEDDGSPYGTNSYPDYLSLGELTSGLEGATASSRTTNGGRGSTFLASLKAMALRPASTSPRSST